MLQFLSFRFQEKGFTVIELLVVIAIVAILPAVIISNFPQIRLNFALSRAAYSFAQNVRLAQEMALSSKPYKDSFGVVQEVKGYGIFVDIATLGNKKYILYADNNQQVSGNNQYDAADYTILTVDLNADEGGVIIRQINGVFNSQKVSINFSPPNPTTTIVQINEGQSSIEVVIALESDSSKTRIISISNAGLVTIN